MEVLNSFPWIQQFREPNEPLWRKLFWSIIFLICLSSTFVLIIDRINVYHDEPVNYQFRIEQPDFYSFPSVTICPAHQFDIEVMKQKAKRNHFITNKTFSSVYELLPNVSLNDIWLNAAPNMDDVLVKCYYTGYKECPVEPWTSQITVIGLCYTISLGYLRMNTSDVLTVTLRLFDTWCPTETPHFSKWKYLIHESKEDITYKVMSKSSSTADSTDTAVFFEESYHYHEPSSRRPCIPYEEYSHCENKCMDNYFLGNRTCRLPFMKTVNLPLCTQEADFRSMYPIPFSKKKYIEVLSTDCDCIRPCNYYNYKMFIDSLARTQSDIDRNITKLAFRPTTARREVTSEIFYYGFLKLLCDIGAVMGFHMGISLLTLIEVIEGVVRFIFTKITLKTTKLTNK